MYAVSLPPKNILLRSITRNALTEPPKGGLETRIYLALRNNLVLGGGGGGRGRNPVDRIFATKLKCGNLSFCYT